MMITRYKYSISILTLLLMISTGLDAQDDITIQDEIVGKAEVSAPGSIVLTDGFKAIAGSDFHAYIGPRQAQPEAITISSPTASATPAAGTTSTNYIKTITYREAELTVPTTSFKHLQTMQYFDGLGRPVQTIGVGTTPGGYDVIQPVLYDNFGRESIKPLSYTDNTKSGNFRSSVTETTVSNYYNTSSTTPAGVESDSRAYTEIGFESSPQNRPLTQTGPGSAWSAKPVTINYLSNDELKPSWSVDDAGTFTSISYGKNNLYVTETIDEQGNIIREYKDKQGLVVFKESKLDGNWLRTTYIYDDFGLLRCVMPPEASDPSTDTELCYYYKYDSRNRMIEKKIPSGGTTTMVYDTRDRLRFSQNSLQKASRQWSFIKYDELNRPVINGIFSTTLAIETFLSTGTLSESRNNTSAYYGYTNTSSPVSSQYIVHSVTYYDDYDFIAGVNLNDSLRSTTYDAGSYDFHAKTNLTPKGRITGTMTRMLLPYANNSNLYATVWYDKYGNVLRKVSENHLKGKDVVSNLYEDITFQVLKSKQEHYKGTERIAIDNTFEYDHTGRLLATRQQVTDMAKTTSQPEITESAMQYNEIGELVTKYLHSEQVSGPCTFLQKEDFGYNLRGWLTRINDPALSSGENDLFGMQLFYNNTNGMGSLAPTAGLYSGNIVGMKWSIKNDLTRGYVFAYDGLNRLKTASYADGSSLNSHAGYFDETIPEYDNNGNIKAFARKYDNILVDDLTYTYTSKSNKLLQITDNGTPSNAVEDYPGTSQNYRYDDNGNMSYDGAKNITLYSYIPNLNLAQAVDFGNNNRINYYYMADGTKFAKQVWVNSLPNHMTHYIGNIVYEDGRLSYIITGEGRLVATGDGASRTFVPEYTLKDHLGNTRVTFSSKTFGGSIVVEQTTNYYPFGLTMNQYNAASLLNYPKNKYLYNGKELQDDNLNGTFFGMLDYGARFYDPQIGRWTTIDPLAEDSLHISLSPFSYALNNPIRFIDPDGRDEWEINGKGEVVKRIENKKEDSFHIVDNEGKRVDGKSITFKYGTITAEKHPTVKVTDANGQSSDKTLTIFDVKGDGNGSSLFKFLANTDNTQVEWTHAEIGTKDSELNIVGTSNEEKSTPVGSYLLSTGYTLKEIDHNHPNGATRPSGGDLANREKYLAKYPNAKLNIYTDKKGINGYRPYTTYHDILKFYPPNL